MAEVRPDKWGYGGWSATGAGGAGGVTVTHALTSGASQSMIAGIQCSGDAAAMVTVESPSGTVLYRKRYAAAFTMSESFAPPIEGAAGQSAIVKVSASTTNSEANIQGYDV